MIYLCINDDFAISDWILPQMRQTNYLKAIIVSFIQLYNKQLHIRINYILSDEGSTVEVNLLDYYRNMIYTYCTSLLVMQEGYTYRFQNQT